MSDIDSAVGNALNEGQLQIARTGQMLQRPYMDAQTQALQQSTAQQAQMFGPQLSQAQIAAKQAQTMADYQAARVKQSMDLFGLNPSQGAASGAASGMPAGAYKSASGDWYAPSAQSAGKSDADSIADLNKPRGYSTRLMPEGTDQYGLATLKPKNVYYSPSPAAVKYIEDNPGKIGSMDADWQPLANEISGAFSKRITGLQDSFKTDSDVTTYLGSGDHIGAYKIGQRLNGLTQNGTVDYSKLNHDEGVNILRAAYPVDSGGQPMSRVGMLELEMEHPGAFARIQNLVSGVERGTIPPGIVKQTYESAMKGVAQSRINFENTLYGIESNPLNANDLAGSRLGKLVPNTAILADYRKSKASVASAAAAAAAAAGPPGTPPPGTLPPGTLPPGAQPVSRPAPASPGAGAASQVGPGSPPQVTPPDLGPAPPPPGAGLPRLPQIQRSPQIQQFIKELSGFMNNPQRGMETARVPASAVLPPSSAKGNGSVSGSAEPPATGGTAARIPFDAGSTAGASRGLAIPASMPLSARGIPMPRNSAEVSQLPPNTSYIDVYGNQRTTPAVLSRASGFALPSRAVRMSRVAGQLTKPPQWAP